ncbi:hypothetical protein N7532_009446 [Penicillium argentinense]|uniref:Uncharacterized protein n=1 Tax=Penicillium argentinense TaxID=1131581 RepID=A0A9W9EZF6_9EURO|nr:uncharacterized protein N7532_009446 [Penicillium argentinense]KAJ5090762.1 hypothetical protein N7532_009446 [Penicillium argentinense]
MAPRDAPNQSSLRIPAQKPGSARPSPAQRPAFPQKPSDIRQTKEYKLAARRWTSTIVALPIVMYTSWILYERVYGDKAPKKLNDPPSSSSSS